MRTLLFDLDNTLCESKQPIEPKMLYELERLNKKYKTIIVSGAELSRIHIQCPVKYMTFMAQNGNEVYDNEQIIWKNEMGNKEDVHNHIKQLAAELNITISDDMIDDRSSEVSFSFIGHHAPREIKKKFDPHGKIRSNLLSKFPYQRAVIGGTTCIDYVPFTKGENVKRYIEMRKMKQWECLYVGDAFMNHGNDATVLGIVPVFQVKSPIDTLRFLKTIW